MARHAVRDQSGMTEITLLAEFKIIESNDGKTLKAERMRNEKRSHIIGVLVWVDSIIAHYT